MQVSYVLLPNDLRKIELQLLASGNWRRGAFSQDKMRVEDCITIAVMDGHIISIEDRPDMNDRFPGGPTERKGR